ncbi:response regulator [Lacinutrix salivirga]
MITLLLVDNHPIVRKGLEFVFSNSKTIQIKASVDNGEDIFNYLKNYSVDVILTEVDLPKLNGLTALRRLKREFPKIKVIFFSSQPEEVYAITAIKLGADGYLSKNSSVITLKEAIEQVTQGNTYLSPVITQNIKKSGTGKKSDGFYKKLSVREIEVLKLLSSGKKNKEIAIELDINEKTVSTYKARLMKKLNVSNLVDLVEKAKTASGLQHAT